MLPSGDSQRVNFPSWNAGVGSYVARCTVALEGDANPANNLRMNPFRVESLNVPPGWTETDHVPPGTSGKPVYFGAGMLVWSDGTTYALKGNKTNEFLAWYPRSDTWRFRDSVPPGPDDKRVYKGGCLTGDLANYVYAVKGNSTTEFYRYFVAADSWQHRAAVPLGTTGKKVKGGTSIVYVVKADTGWCYLLKGYKNEFYRYNTIVNRWDTFLPPAPLGPSQKDKYKGGSFLCYDREYTIYCLKGTYNELFAFDVRGDTWYTAPLSPFPRIGRSGRSKKVKDGGSATLYDGEVYALKGGNTCEFWRYSPVADSWFELDTMPQMGSTGKKKKVKGGGSIVSAGRTVFYAFKGSKTFEFWRYRIPPAGPGVEENLQRSARSDRPATTIVRNVLFVPPSPDARHSALFDLTGRRIMPLRAGENDVSGLSPGVYFLRTERSAVGGQPSAVTKVIIE
jgi:hypothetical protein